ncbi:hypothetical protein [Ottowia thiooxydans]
MTEGESGGKRLHVYLGVFLFALYVLCAVPFSGPAYLSDEIGYLTKAAALGGSDVDYATSWFGGYSILIAPLFLIFDNYEMVWRGVQFFNALMFFGSFLLTRKILKSFFPGEHEGEILLALSVAALYPSWLVLTAYSFTTPAIVFCFCLSLYMFTRIEKGLLFVCVSSLVVGFIYWIHPTGLAAIFGAWASYFLYARRNGQWGYFLVCTVITILMVLAYQFVFHPGLNLAMTPVGYAQDSHYTEGKSLSERLIELDFYKNFGFKLISQTLALLISSFGLVGAAFFYLFLKFRKSVRLSEGDEGVLDILGVWLMVTCLAALGMGAASLSLQPDVERTDIWIYGRYSEPFIYPMLAIGLVSAYRGFNKKLLCVLAVIMAVFFIYGSNVEIKGFNNLVNISSFWPYALFPEKDVNFWLGVGVGGVCCILYLPRNFAVVLALFLSIACFQFGISWHFNILSKHSKPDALVNFIYENFEENTCVAFDDRKSSQGQSERRNLLAFYLFNYNFRRYSFNDWFLNCNGIFLSQEELFALPSDVKKIAGSNRSGISVYAKNEDIKKLDFAAFFDSDYFYDSKGELSCLHVSCLYLPANRLADFSGVGELSGGRLLSVGTAGVLFHGPYVSWDKGSYRIEISLNGSDATGARLDATSEAGKNLHFVKKITNEELNQGHAYVSFTLDEDVNAFEVRLFVDEHSKIAVQSVRLVPEALP